MATTYPTAYLRPGMTGDTVKQLQDYLVSQNLMTQAQVQTGYGIYGPQTTAAVKALQDKYKVDYGQYAGYWGPKTLAAIQNAPTFQSPTTNADDLSKGNTSLVYGGGSAGTPPDVDSGYLAKEKTALELMQEANANYQKQLEEANKTNADIKNQITGLQTQLPDKKAMFAELGIDPAQYYAGRKTDVAELEAKYDEYNKAVEAKNLQLNAIEAQTIPLNIMTRKMTKAEKDANVRLNTMAAGINSKIGIMELKKGDFESANNYIDKAISQAMDVYKMKRDDLIQMYNMNQDTIQNLGKDYQNAITNAINIQKIIVDEKQFHYGTITRLMNENPNANWGAFDWQNGTIEEAMQIAAKNPGKPTGESVVDVRNRNEAYAGELAYLETLGDKQKVFDYINTHQASLVANMGEENFAKILNWVAVNYPEQQAVEAPQTPPTPAEKAGVQTAQTIKGVLRPVGGFLTKTFDVTPQLETIGGFFKGLFKF